MAKHLFTVKDVLEIEGKGLLLGPGVEIAQGVKSGDAIELRAPSGKTHKATLIAVAFLSPSPGEPPKTPILVSAPRNAVPPGTEVWTSA